MSRFTILLLCLCLAGDSVFGLYRVDSSRNHKLRVTDEDDSSSISFLYGFAQEMNKKLGGIFHDVYELKKTTAALMVTTASLQVQIDTLSASVDVTVGSLNKTLTEEIDQVKKTLTASITDLETSLTGKISKVTDDQTDLNKTLTAHISSINSSLSSDIQKLDSNLKNLNASLKSEIDGVNTELCGKIDQLNTTVSKEIATVSSDLAADVKKLEDDQKSLTDNFNTQIAALNRDVTGQATKLEQLTASVQQHVSTLQGEINDLELLDECYSYEHAKVNGSWSDLKKYCNTKGGQLAFHKMQSLESRRQIASDTGVLDSGDFFWWGLSRANSTSDWMYVDGTKAATDDVHWGPNFPNNATGLDCVAMFVNVDNPVGLYSANAKCDGPLSGICEYKC